MTAAGSWKLAAVRVGCFLPKPLLSGRRLRCRTCYGSSRASAVEICSPASHDIGFPSNVYSVTFHQKMAASVIEWPAAPICSSVIVFVVRV